MRAEEPEQTMVAVFPDKSDMVEHTSALTEEGGAAGWPVASASTPPATRSCPECGKELRESAAFCTGCGLALAPPAAAQPLAEQPAPFDDRKADKDCCECFPCNSPRRRRMWCGCCGATFIILLSFFLAIYLPLMDFINGFKMRLVHVDVMDLCSNPMRLSLRAQVSNPAHVRVKIDDLGMQLRGPQGALLEVSTSAPLLVPGRTKEANISVTLLMDTLLESDAAQALSDLQTNTALQEYEVVYGAGLDLRIIALPFYYRFQGQSSLADSEDEDPDDAAKNAQEAQPKRCDVNASCWFTTFENECCRTEGSLSKIRFLSVRDAAEALSVQTEAEMVSPLARVTMPNLTCSVYLHRKDAAVPAAPAIRMSLTQAEDAGVLTPAQARATSAFWGEVAVTPAVIPSLDTLQTSLGSGEEGGGGGDLAATAKMESTDASKSCQLQRLLAKVEISSGARSATSSRRARRYQWDSPTSWIPAATVFEPSTELDFRFEDYGVKQPPGVACGAWNACSNVTLTFAVNNIMAFPLRVMAPAYIFSMSVPPAGSVKSQYGQHPAMTVTMPAQDTEYRSRNSILLKADLSFDNMTRVGREVLGPAFVGKPLMLWPQMQVMTGQDKTVVTMLSEWALEMAFEDGVQLKETAAGAKPPLVAIVGFMRQLSMSYATNDLLLDFAFKAKFPGAQLFIPIEIPVIGLNLTEGRREALQATFSFDTDLQGINMDLKVVVKDARTECSALLAAIAFDRSTVIPGVISVVDQPKGLNLAFPIRLDLAQGFWRVQPLLQPGPSFESVALGYSASSYCGFSSGTVSASVCNRQGKTIKADLTQVQARVTSSAAGMAPITPPMSFSLPNGADSFPFAAGSCASTTANAAGTYSTTPSLNASCALHSTSAAAASGLGLSLSNVTVNNVCTCTAGINKCDSTSTAWTCNTAAAFPISICVDA